MPSRRSVLTWVATRADFRCRRDIARNFGREMVTAFASIDAHAALAYFNSRGWKTPSHPTFWKRFSCRGEPIVVQKPA